eukprot:m.481937 g.481937  ORF g.481937 m.481937 type:complete len:396 (+) comp22389_c0_seq1:127-1314(+)
MAGGSCRWVVWLFVAVLANAQEVAPADDLTPQLQNPRPPRCADPWLCEPRHSPSVIQREWRELLEAVGKFEPQWRNPCWRVVNADNDGGKKRGGKQRAKTTVRCLPAFFVLGVAKCGTTDLHLKLSMHPEIAQPGRKEPHWLTRPRERSVGWYLNVFRGPTVARGNLLVYDASASTFWDRSPDNPLASKVSIPEVLATINPAFRHVVMFRNPTERAWSDYRYFCPRSARACTVSAEQFHRLVTRQVRLYEECLAKYASIECFYKRFFQHSLPRLALGVYIDPLKVWWRYFKPEQVFVMRTETLASSPRRVYDKLFEFLGVGPAPKQILDAIASQERGNVNAAAANVTMLPKTRKLLDDFYAPHNKRLFAALRAHNVWTDGFPLDQPGIATSDGTW